MTIFSLLRSVAGTQRQLVLAAILLSSPAVSQAVILEWNPNSETNLAGYKIYMGPASRQYTTNFTTTNTVFTIPNTNLFHSTNYFSVTAFDTDGLESDFSDEVFWVNSTNRPTQVKGLRLRKLFVQSAPSVMGPWGQDVEIAQIETASGAEFYRLRIGPALAEKETAKKFLTAPAPKGARIMPGRMAPPPTPPK